MEGVELFEADQGIQFNGVQTKAHGVRVVGQLGFHFQHYVALKMTIPSPSVLHFRGGRKVIDETVYPDLADLLRDLAETCKTAIKAFYDAGCCYLQLDDTVCAYPSLYSEDQKRQIRKRGDDPEQLAQTYARVLNKTLEGKPAYLTVDLHVCRGNFRST